MKRAIIMASLLAVAAMGTGLAVEPAFSAPTNHTLTFVSRNLASQQSAPNHLLQASTNQVAGATVGFAASTCTDHFSTGVFTCASPRPASPACSTPTCPSTPTTAR